MVVNALGIPTQLYNSLLREQAEVWRQPAGSVRDENGRITRAPVKISGELPCWLQPAGSNSEKLQTSGDRVENQFTLFMEAGVDLTEKDRVHIGGVEYQVLNVEDSGGVGHHTEAVVMVVNTGGV